MEKPVRTKEKHNGRDIVLLLFKNRESGVDGGVNIIISSTKKMDVREDELDLADLPCFLSKAEVLREYIRNLSREEARSMWAYNERIAVLNYERFRNIDPTSRFISALLSHERIQHQHMTLGVLEQES